MISKTLLALSAALFFQTLPSQALPRVSVLRFNQEAGQIYSGCHGWLYDRQDQLRTELEGELKKRGLHVLERRQIRTIHEDEYELPNLDRASVPKRGRFLSAQYTVTGAVTEVGICEQSSGSSLQLGGVIALLGGPSANLAAGRKDAVSKVKLVAHLVSVETGEILQTFEARGEVVDKGYNLEGVLLGIGAAHRERIAPPIERASHEAIQELASQIANHVAKSP